MERLACINVFELPLQLLLKQHPDWYQMPAVVVDRDHPQGRVLRTNKLARCSGVKEGIRYGAALSLEPQLQAGTVAQDYIEAFHHDLARRLLEFSPVVEPCEREPGIYWLNATGFDRFHGSYERWVSLLQEALQAEQLWASVAVGFQRFASYAAAKATRRTLVFESDAQEQTYMRGILLECVQMDIKAKRELQKLGVETLGQFLDLPALGIMERFGKEVYRLRCQLAGEVFQPLQGTQVVAPIESDVDFILPEIQIERVIFWVTQELKQHCECLRRKQQQLESLDLSFFFEQGSKETITLKSAEPTLCLTQWRELLTLRLSRFELPSGISRLHLHLKGINAQRIQKRLFQYGDSNRDLDAAKRSIARICAEFGEESVKIAQLKHAHLPEGAFSWLLPTKIVLPKCKTLGVSKRLVRRVLEKPRKLNNYAPRRGVRGVAFPSGGVPQKVDGPHEVSGGWWQGEVRRQYYFVHMKNGAVYWIYFDEMRRRWFLHGTVG